MVLHFAYFFWYDKKSVKEGEKMKWSKALNALIIMFLMMNVLLGFGNYTKNVTAYHISDGRIASIKSILNNKGIIFECELPRSFRPLETLWLELVEIESTLRAQLVENVFGKNNNDVTISKESSEEPYEKPTLIYSNKKQELKFKHNEVIYTNKVINKEEVLMKKDDALKLARDFVDNLKLEGKFKKVKIDYRIESYGAIVTYYEVYNQLPVFDSYIHMEITPEGVQQARIQGAKLVEKNGTTKPLNPIDKVLFDIEEQIEKKPPLVIENIQLGYSMKNKEGMHILEEEAVPMYKIDVKGLSEPVFVNAYTK